METFFIYSGITLLLMMAPVFYRIIVGPTAIDRIVAVNVIGTKTAVLLIIIGMLFDDVAMFVDFALAYALLNFIGSLAAARYFNKTRPAYGAGSSGKGEMT
ncbi:MAG: pH regulation protein F [Verrucomicrobiaceae bacterium]|nr:pH regulation protein F [Verrucomicrobiaceae bacterium]